MHPCYVLYGAHFSFPHIYPRTRTRTLTYTQEYNACLSRIRSFLAGTRNRSTLTECERLLRQAQQCATAMQGEAEISGDPLRITDAQQRLERDIAPLSREVSRQLHEMNRKEELFGDDDVEQHGHHTGSLNSGGSDSHMMMQSLIQSSDDLLRESQSILVETEYIGNQTLQQMGRQREQLQHTNANLAAVQRAAGRAHVILRDMSRRACRSRLALYGMIAVLGAAHVWVLYAIYKKHHPQQSTPAPN